MSKEILTKRQRRRRYRQEIIDDILAIAREMMQKDGVAALGFNGIARRLGMRPPSLYTYFESKDAIYDELFRRGFEEFGRRMEERLSGGGSAAELLQGTMETYMGFAQENPDLYQLMFQRPVPGFVPSERSMAVSLGMLQKSREHSKALMSAGQLNPELPVEEASDLVNALMHGLTEFHLANNPELPVGQGRFGKLIPHAVQLFLDAWGSS